ncbi:MAG: AIR carboxylase family protein [Candidatus Lokiarchaeota archaeon]|nr:AIR carboxylase family protein [Candidatus Lokiarchaeota archaeon]
MPSKIDVAVIAGSESDENVYSKAIQILEEHNIAYDLQIISAHRDPDKLTKYVNDTTAKVFICIAGLSAALPGVVASKTEKLVIGVPVSAKLGGLDALLSIAQMPSGIPVACVGIDNAKNAAYMAIRVLKLIQNK